MALYEVKNGQTGNVFRVKLLDATSTTNKGLTGLTFSTSGLIISTICDVEATATAYTAAGSTIETITTLGSFAAPTATKIRFKEVDATNHPGVYEVQLDDTRMNRTNAKSILLTFSGATNLAQTDVVINLPVFDPYSAVNPVTLANAAHGGAAAVLTVKNIVVNNTSGTGIDITGTGHGINITPGSAGHGVSIALGASTGNGINITGSGTSSSAIYGSMSGGSSKGMYLSGGNAGISANGSTSNSFGIYAYSAGTSSCSGIYSYGPEGIRSTGNAGPGIYANGSTYGLSLASLNVDGTSTLTGGLLTNISGALSGSVGSVTSGVTLATSQPNYAPAKAGNAMTLVASQHVIVDSGTVTTLTNLPAIPAGWLTAAGIAASALNGKGDWGTYAGGDTAGTTTLLTRLSATRSGYLDNLSVAPMTTLGANAPAGWLNAAAFSTAPAWYTAGGGGSGATAVEIRQEMDANSTKLANMDAAISSRLAASAYSAPTTPPSTAAIAAAVGATFDSATITSLGSPGTVLVDHIPSCLTFDGWGLMVVAQPDGTRRVKTCQVLNIGSVHACSYTPTLTDDNRSVGDVLTFYPTNALARLGDLNGIVSGTAGSVAAISAKLSGMTITVSAPVTSGGDVQIVWGDDYAAADGRALIWNGSGWPDLTGAAITFTVADPGVTPDYISATSGTVIAAGAVQVELTAAQTRALPERSASAKTTHRYTLTATLLGGHIVTLAQGNVVVLTKVA